MLGAIGGLILQWSAAGGIGGLRLSAAVALSLALHLLGLGLILARGVSPLQGASTVLSVSLPRTIPPAEQSGKGRQQSALASVTALDPKTMPLSEGDGMSHSFAPHARGVYSGEDLDAPLQVIESPEIEPPYGFADDVSGRVLLSLLVGPSGNVLWVGTGETMLDDSTLRYIEDSFRTARFSVPNVGGMPVVAILRIEVEVGKQLHP